MIYEFTFNLKPESHADATMFSRKTGTAYTPDKKRKYQTKAIASFRAKAAYKYPLEGPLVAFWVFYMSRSEKDLAPAEKNEHHFTKPDADGLLKVVQDLIQEGKISHKSMGWRSPWRLGVLKDDCQITLDCIEKVWVKKGQLPHIKLILWKPTKPPPLMRYLVKALVASET